MLSCTREAGVKKAANTRRAGNHPLSGLSVKNPTSGKGVKLSGSTFRLWTSLICVLPWHSCQGTAEILRVQQPSLQTPCLSQVLTVPSSAGPQSEPGSRGNAAILRQRLNKSCAINCLKANASDTKKPTYKILAYLSDTKSQAVVAIVFLLCAVKCLAHKSPARIQGSTQKRMPLNILNSELKPVLSK